MKILQTGFFCLYALVVCGSQSGRAQNAVADPPPVVVADPPKGADQNPTSQNPAGQNPTSQAPAQQTPPPQTPPPPTQPSDQTPTGPNVRVAPELPKYPDVRLPGEYGFYFGLNGWVPKEQPVFNKGRLSGITNSSLVTLQGKPKLAEGFEAGVALGLHNALRISAFESRAAGDFTTNVPLSVWGQTYGKGTLITTDYLVQNVKISFEYLTWPYPVESRRFRFKTLYQVQYTSVRTGFDAPQLATTDSAGNPIIDSSGNPISYATQGTRWFLMPTLGASASQYLNKYVHIEASGDGFAIPHHSTLYEGEGTVNVRVGHLEFRGGGKTFHFKTSTNGPFYIRNTMASVFFGIRWFSR